jgi:hypothetical protein
VSWRVATSDARESSFSLRATTMLTDPTEEEGASTISEGNESTKLIGNATLLLTTILDKIIFH